MSEDIITMYSNFIFNYTRIERERKKRGWKRKNERIEKENNKPERSPFILDISTIMLMTTEWNRAWNRPRL
jgi:hypothetical protein